ncbi:MAG: DUF4861 family protein, partial [Verrucomicrobia bacterium]|nr:DUF4861 family protein [Verrucomicrobiota bacterium]
KMIAPLRKKFDYILANPPTTTLNFSQSGHGQQGWSWCDSLFMAPPAWVRLYAATGNQGYLDFAVKNWWRTTGYLYDKKENLFFRDSTYFDKREPNGEKVFWSRGNGWVLAGLVRTLQYLPMNDPQRPRFVRLFRQMAEKILTLQQPDGLWPAALLDAKDYPAKETSGSALFTYALAWGVNQGLLDRTKFEPAVRKAWAALIGCVAADGKLTNVQPIGANPKHFDPDSTAPFGVGAFLLAGSEVYRMAVLKNAAPVAVKVTNPSGFRRDCETVEVRGAALPGLDKSWAVMDGISSRILDSQSYSPEPGRAPDRLLFQVDLAPHETRTYDVLDAAALAAVPRPIVKTYARYVPERYDDFAWESDRIEHRLFGQGVIKAEGLISSGVDVWIKRRHQLIINEMYRSGDYYNTNASAVAQDDYKVGQTRGCGGLGIWKDGKLYVSGNWRNWKLITSGPVRSEFEVTYDAWDVAGRKVSETKRVSIDAGSNMNRMESIFSSSDKSPLRIGVGLAERPGDNVTVRDGSSLIDSWRSSTAKGLVVRDENEGWMAYWQPRDFDKGTIGVAVVLPKGSVEAFTTDKPNLPASAFLAPTNTIQEGQVAVRNLLAVAPARVGRPFVYYIGAGWDQSGDFPNAKSWVDYVRRFAERRDHPLKVRIGN